MSEKHKRDQIVKLPKIREIPTLLFSREARRNFFWRSLLFLVQEAATHTVSWTSAGPEGRSIIRAAATRTVSWTSAGA